MLLFSAAKESQYCIMVQKITFKLHGEKKLFWEGKGISPVQIGAFLVNSLIHFMKKVLNDNNLKYIYTAPFQMLKTPKVPKNKNYKIFEFVFKNKVSS